MGGDKPRPYTGMAMILSLSKLVRMRRDGPLGFLSNLYLSCVMPSVHSNQRSKVSLGLEPLIF